MNYLHFKIISDIKVVDFVAQVTLTQEYVNQEINPIEVLYSYPVEESAAIVAFEANIDGHEIQAVVKEKQQAKNDYNQAMQMGHSAILLEETAPDIFSMKLGQLKAGAGAKVKLTYIMELPVEEKAIRLSVPTTIAPRYIPPNDDSQAAQEIAKLTYNSECQASAPLKITVESIMKSFIKSIYSPSHDLKTTIQPKPDENGQFISTTVLSNDAASITIMDRDLVILIKTDDESHSKPVVFIEEGESSKAALVSLIPSFKLDDQKCELVFLIDRSGSMQGKSIAQAVKALELFLHSIPADCYFNIWSFGSNFSSLFEKGSCLYDDSTLTKAKNHVAKIKADYGGTEVYNPLQAIFKQKLIEGYARQVILLTDGDVSNSDSVIHLVKQNASKNRVFTLGLGSSASRHLVKGVARAGNGISTFATLNEDLRPKVMTILKNTLMSSLSQVEVLWNNEEKKKTNESVQTMRTLLGFNKPLKENKVEDDKIGPSVLFDGSRMLMFKIFDKDVKLKSVTIRAQAPDGPLSVEVPIHKDCYLEGGNYVHQLAIRRQIQDMEESGNFEDEKIKSLALQYGLASRFTSFVGVDKNTKKDVLEPAMSTRQIKQEIPFEFGCEFYSSKSHSR